MKRKDLTVGETYYYDRSGDWLLSDYSSGRRVVVVDIAPYRIERARWGFRTETHYRSDPKGTAVLVEGEGWGGKTETFAVPLAHLRGLWEQTKAEVEAARKHQQTERDQVKARATRERNVAADALVQAAEMGVKASQDLMQSWQVKVPTVEFAAMVAALAAVGWHYEKQS